MHAIAAEQRDVGRSLDRSEAAAACAEFHDLPNTPTRKDCWIGVIHTTVGVLCVYYSNSRESGASFPGEDEWIPR
jgi:hypothetical protein